jgi:hypothetical protein
MTSGRGPPRGVEAKATRRRIQLLRLPWASVPSQLAMYLARAVKPPSTDEDTYPTFHTYSRPWPGNRALLGYGLSGELGVTAAGPPLPKVWRAPVPVSDPRHVKVKSHPWLLRSNETVVLTEAQLSSKARTDKAYPSQQHNHSHDIAPPPAQRKLSGRVQSPALARTWTVSATSISRKNRPSCASNVSAEAEKSLEVQLSGVYLTGKLMARRRRGEHPATELQPPTQ